jgi:hypothetical protein
VGGSSSPAVLEGLRAAETERERLEETIHQHAPLLAPISLVPRTQARFANLLRSLEEVVQRPSPQVALRMEASRAQLKLLLGGAVKLYPAANGAGPDAALGGDYAGLLKIAVGDSK